jgi:ferrous iron transport protein B
MSDRAAELGVPVIPISGLTGDGLPGLLDAIARHQGHPAPKSGLPAPLSTEARALAQFLAAARRIDPTVALAMAGVLIGRDESADDPWNVDEALRSRVVAARERLGKDGRDWRCELVEKRYARIHALCERFVARPEITGRSRTDRVDAILMHPILGWGFFVIAVATIFFVIFSVANQPMEWIDAGFAGLADLMREKLPEGLLRDLLTDGVVPGVGGVLIFLPQILGLFLILGLLEDSGLMARGAFIVDRLMSRVGLHGKSFIPLMSSFACAVPGIMATRVIEERRPRLATILIAPFMCCSARLPVYLLMIGALVPNRVLDPLAKSLVMAGLYLLGIAAAFITAKMLNRTVLSGPPLHLVLELPPYRRPSIRAVLRMVWERGALFLTKAGTVILAFSIVLWALMTWPRLPEATPAEALRHSVAGRLGQVIEPAIEPLGFDWRIGVGIISSFVAREVFVSTMGIVFNIEEADEENPSLIEALRRASWPDGRPLITPTVAIGLMIFYALAMQCIATMAVVKVETGGWRWPLIQFVWMTGLAWCAVFLFRQIALAAGWT